MKSFKKMFCMIVVLMMLPVMTVTAQRQVLRSKPSVLKSLVTVKLKTAKKYYVGVCPIKVKMTGTIKVPKAMTVKCYFKRSDGVQLRVPPLIFIGADTKIIPFSWKIFKDYQGWVQLIVKTTSSEVKSNKVEFRVNCNERKQIKPKLASAPKFNINKNVFQIIKDKARKSHVDLKINWIMSWVLDGYNKQKVLFRVSVKNYGRKSSGPCKISFKFKKLVSGYPMGYKPMGGTLVYNFPGINGGGEVTADFPFVNFSIGSWRAYIKIDSSNIILESNEMNNSGYEDFHPG